jgi:diacylglycerol kinase
MPVKLLPRVIRNTLEGRFLSLLAAILVYLAIGPVLDKTKEFKFFLDIFFSIILLAGIFAVSQKKRSTIIAFTFAIPSLVTVWLRELTGGIALEITSSVLTTLFFGYAVIVLLAFILNSTRVTHNVIYAALIGYLIMGLMWASIYSLIDTITPGSFKALQSSIDNPRLIYLYFSYVTLTTLGYGDISPLTAPAYSFSILEAIIGQIYLTVLIARLVAMHITHSDRGSRNGLDR